MRLTVINVTHLARLALVLSASVPVAASLLKAYQVGAQFATEWPVRLVVGLGMATFAFAAAPRSRRSDMMGLIGAYVLCLLLMDRWFQGIWRTDALIACYGGGCAVFVCSCLESLRRLARLTPEADVSNVYPMRRRFPFAPARMREPAI